MTLTYEFPVGTRFWEVDGKPVAALPGEPPKRYDRTPPAWCDAQELANNGMAISREAFLALLQERGPR